MRTGRADDLPSVAAATTWLFVPASRPDRFAKAGAAGADVVLLDLEDAVAAQDKASARGAASEWVDTHPAVVRVNGAGSAWHAQDLAALRGRRMLAGVMVPKAESVAALATVDDALGGEVPILALIESAVGLLEARSIAGAARVARLAFGNLDFAADCGLTVDDTSGSELLHARSTLVVASRAAGLPGPLDGVHPDVNDFQGLEATTARVARLGFTGKLCIHPKQVPTVARALAPRPEEVDRARRILAAAQTAGTAAFLLDGAMVDAPVLRRAEAVVARASQSTL